MFDWAVNTALGSLVKLWGTTSFFGGPPTFFGRPPAFLVGQQFFAQIPDRHFIVHWTHVIKTTFFAVFSKNKIDKRLREGRSLFCTREGKIHLLHTLLPTQYLIVNHKYLELKAG